MTPILTAEGETIEHIYVDGIDVIDNAFFDLEGEEPVLGAELAEEPNNPILPETKEVIWGGLAFFILFAILAKVAFPAIKKTMEDRTSKIEGDLAAAESAKDEAQRLQREYEASLANAKAEANRLVEEARAEIEGSRAEKIAAVDAEVAQRRAAALESIENDKAQATAQLKGQIATLAIGAAEKVVGQNLDTSANTQIVEAYINEVASQ